MSTLLIVLLLVLLIGGGSGYYGFRNYGGIMGGGSFGIGSLILLVFLFYLLSSMRGCGG